MIQFLQSSVTSSLLGPKAPSLWFVSGHSTNNITQEAQKDNVSNHQQDTTW
jgi:hypothetical protein